MLEKLSGVKTVNKSKSSVWLAYVLKPSITFLDEDDEEFVMDLDYMPGMVGMMPVYATKAQALEAHGKGTLVKEVFARPDDSQ